MLARSGIIVAVCLNSYPFPLLFVIHSTLVAHLYFQTSTSGLIFCALSHCYLLSLALFSWRTKKGGVIKPTTPPSLFTDLVIQAA